MIMMARFAAIAFPAENAIVSRRARLSEQAPQAMTSTRAAALRAMSLRDDSTAASIFHIEHVAAGTWLHGNRLCGLRRFLPSEQKSVDVVGGHVVLERCPQPRAGRCGLDQARGDDHH